MAGMGDNELVAQMPLPCDDFFCDFLTERIWVLWRPERPRSQSVDGPTHVFASIEGMSRRPDTGRSYCFQHRSRNTKHRADPCWRYGFLVKCWLHFSRCYRVFNISIEISSLPHSYGTDLSVPCDVPIWATHISTRKGVHWHWSITRKITQGIGGCFDKRPHRTTNHSFV